MGFYLTPKHEHLFKGNLTNNLYRINWNFQSNNKGVLISYNKGNKYDYSNDLKKFLYLKRRLLNGRADLPEPQNIQEPSLYHTLQDIQSDIENMEKTGFIKKLKSKRK